MTLTQHDIDTMENNTLLNGGIINIFEKILDSRYKIKNQAIVPTYVYTSLLAYDWEKGPRRYFKQYAILKNDKKGIRIVEQLQHH